VQSLLGEHHDIVTPVWCWANLGVHAQLDGANGFTFDVLHVEEHPSARALEARMPAVSARVATAR